MRGSVVNNTTLSRKMLYSNERNYIFRPAVAIFMVPQTIKLSLYNLCEGMLMKRCAKGNKLTTLPISNSANDTTHVHSVKSSTSLRRHTGIKKTDPELCRKLQTHETTKSTKATDTKDPPRRREKECNKPDFATYVYAAPGQ